MELRRKLILRVVGFTFVVVAVLGFALEVALKVLGGKSLETYLSGTMIEWSYGAALVTIIALALAALVAGLVRVGHFVMERREIKRLAQQHGVPSIAPNGGDPLSPDKSLDRTRGK